MESHTQVTTMFGRIQIGRDLLGLGSRLIVRGGLASLSFYNTEQSPQ